MKSMFVASLLLLSLAACTPRQRSPDQIRQDTAKATKEAAQDVKAVAQGVEDGLKAHGPVNINTASADDLKSLPGIDDAAAHRIIDNRPYDDSYDLVKKRVITKHEYDQIAGRVKSR
ncbi:MAG TPA: helix-hairpin-helix domain-containing protein [Terracidiphilus sp.]|jgi:DNA uptake protein ComE-like DNA-binding protein|nr:helix-hairpin-helix domain-containing protein [Terracidiphilus sp.]